MTSQVISRRNALKSALTAAAVPALPAATFVNLGSRAVHSEADFRVSFEAYLAAYVAFYGPDASYDAYDDCDLSYEESLAFDKHRLALCSAWSESRGRLLAMVLENHGLDPETAFVNVAGLAVDLPDVSFVVSGFEESEGEGGGHNTLAIVPRSPELRRRLEALPQWEPDTRCPDDRDPDTWEARTHFHQERLLEEQTAKLPTFDASRMPAGEPVPEEVEIFDVGDDHKRVIRHWKPEDALRCDRCWLCPHRDTKLEDVKLPDLRCEMTVHADDVDAVLYSPTPSETTTAPEIEKATRLNRSLHYTDGSAITINMVETEMFETLVDAIDPHIVKFKVLDGRFTISVDLDDQPFPYIFHEAEHQARKRARLMAASKD